MSGQADLDGRMALDRMLEAALRHEADRAAAAQPSMEVALARLAADLGTGRDARVRGPRAAVIAWLTLLLLVAAALVAIGAYLLRQDQRDPIVAGPFGPPSTCGTVPLADGMPLRAFRDDAVLSIEGSGLVTVLSGDPADSPPANEGSFRTRVLSRFVTGVLTPAGITLVLDRVTALNLESGCYRVRAQEGDRAIDANTAAGPLGVSFGSGNGAGTLAATVGAADEARLNELLDALFALESWVPPDVFTVIAPADIDAWVVHTTFRPTGFARNKVVDLGDGAVASADDGRFAAVSLPGGASLEEFGNAIPGAAAFEMVIFSAFDDWRAPDQRCRVIRRSEALTLADSLDSVTLGAEEGPDLYTPDMATAITIRLHPAIGSHATCAGFAAAINSHVQPAPEPSPLVEGDLAAVDPCSFVPSDLIGAVEIEPWDQLGSPFGVAARPCILEWHHSMTEGGAERVLWLYPALASEADARMLSTWIFGRAEERTVDGSPVWLNACLAEERSWLACRWAAASQRGGRYLLLEVSDPAATVDETLATLGQIISAID
jgi:hypothetical protein